ncbi:MFS transporter [Fodinicola acaciae]|uniref:MFS transporter n=1 Tax=Fodinicola acaciae TaxID=2681555 RepID=UPI001C9E7637|nr:MFS transporter [Fodinicola acaciae]
MTEKGTWGELLGSRYLGTATVLAGGVLLEASNVYLTTSLLPTAIADIGGARFYAWTMTVFLLASVVSAILVSRVLARLGARGAYAVGFGLFALGSAVAAVSPAMEALLAGRVVQGLGGGLMAGLGYAVIRSALPARLWARAAALASAMWGVGNLAGPAVGGLFAQFGAWRLAFVLLAVTAAAAIALAFRTLPAGERSSDASGRIPVVSLGLLTVAVGVVSVASVVPPGPLTVAGIAVALVPVAVFVAYERKSAARVLPATTYAPRSDLKWIYLTVAFLSLGIGTETFIPLFGQDLGGLPPLAAGFLGAALSFGWSISQLVSSNATSPRLVRGLQIAGPALLTVGLAAYASLQSTGPGAAIIALWVVALMVSGAGIGIAFPHLTVAVMSASSDKTEGEKAAAGINTVMLITNGFGTALAGLLVNLGAPSLVDSAHYLLIGFAAIIAFGVLTAIRAGSAGSPGSRSLTGQHQNDDGSGTEDDVADQRGRARHVERGGVDEAEPHVREQQAAGDREAMRATPANTP